VLDKSAVRKWILPALPKVFFIKAVFNIVHPAILPAVASKLPCAVTEKTALLPYVSVAPAKKTLSVYSDGFRIPTYRVALGVILPST
jgi:hypothetical protein